MSIRKIAFAGNPNVGKSTIFNALTGMKQHTGNWSGKTVGSAEGVLKYKGREVTLVDLPGTYSLITDSAEEEVTRDYLCFEHYDAAVVVCDACCLERNLILALQVAQLVPRVLICVNMMDDARKKGIAISFSALSEAMGIPVVGVSGATGEGLPELRKMLINLSEGELESKFVPVRYPERIDGAVKRIYPVFERRYGFKGIYPVLRILENEHGFVSAFENRFGKISGGEKTALEREKTALADMNVADKISACTVLRAEEICNFAVKADTERKLLKDRKTDSVLTGKIFGIPIMLLMFGFIFWVTFSGANYPSKWLSDMFFEVGLGLESALKWLETPPLITSLIIDGIWKVLSWVVSVMLPPMAIFFPLFTILEDVGYLPRVAFNLDRGFKSSGACGKQSLTMCMGIGCGAVGVTGARIIDSPRERIISIITNSFMPCNGRLPAIILLITMFFTDSAVLGAFAMTGVLVFCVLITLLVSKILSKTVLKGTPTGFTLELPPYRMPKIGKVIIRSVFDRTLKILWRAVIVAIPAGVILWLCSNFSFGGKTVLEAVSGFLEPAGRIIGLDGEIICGFIFSLPANEITLPVIAMAYSGEELMEMGMAETAELFMANGFDSVRALCMIVFFLFHWPCATTILTIWKETKSIKWTALSVIVPLTVGICLCLVINMCSKLFFL